MAEYYGIDVSSNNKKPDWKKVRASGMQYAILRITQRYGLDDSFEHNFAGCKANGIKVGVYRVSYAKTVAQAKKEADDVVSTLAGRGLDFPVFYDLEWDEQRKTVPSETMGLIIKTFWSVIKTAGYRFGIYTNDDWYNNYLPDDAKHYDFWIASYPRTDTGVIVERLRPKHGVGWQYSSKGKVDGVETNVDRDVFYTDYSEVSKTGIKAQDAIAVAKSWIGRKEADNSHRAIIDIYNNHKPLARGYKVKYTDAWCDTTISAIFISLSAVDAIGGTECGVEEHVKLFEKAGIWDENGSITPAPGDLIVYNWDKASQPNDGYSDHIGIVEKVTAKQITCIEGNYKDSVARRQIPIGWGYIRGYAHPKYMKVEKPKEEPTKEEPKKNEELSDGTSGSGGLSKTPKWVGRVTASLLNVRTWAGVNNPTIKSYPLLANGNLVDVCDEVKAADGSKWYYVRIAGKYYGFVSANWIARN